MQRKLKSFLAGLLSLAVFITANPTIIAFAKPAESETVYYVATDGSDVSGDGSITNPFASLTHAILYIRDNNEENHKTVYLRGGSYLVTEPVILTGGVNDINITSFPGERAELTAKKTVPASAFSHVTGKMRDILPESSKDKVVVADLEDAGLSLSDFPEIPQENNPLRNQPLLMDGDNICSLSSHPNGENSWEWYPTYGFDPYSIYCDDTVGSWTYNINDIYGYGFFNLFYVLQAFKVESINSSNNMVRFPTTVNGVRVYPFAHYSELMGQRWIKFVNVYEAMDQPGEYYVDRNNGKLYYYPMTDDANIRLTVSGHVSANGEDLSTITNYGCNNINISNIDFRSMGSAINYLVADSSTISNCTFDALTVNAVVLDQTSGINISGCSFSNIGGSAVWISGEIDTDDLVPQNNVVTGNEFSNIGCIDRVYSPAIGLQGIGCTVSDNIIHDLPHSAIIFIGPNNLITGNDIYDVCQDCGDAAAIYSSTNLWTMGTVISDNHIHDCAAPAGKFGRLTRGIYLDDAVSGVTVTHNIFGPFAGTQSSTYMNGGVHNTVTENIYINSASSDKTVAPEKAACMLNWNENSWRNFITEHRNSQDPDAGMRMPSESDNPNWFSAFPWLGNIEEYYSSDYRMNDIFEKNVCTYIGVPAAESVDDLSGSVDNDGAYDFENKADNLIIEDGTPFFELTTKEDGHSHYELNDTGLAKIRETYNDFPDLRGNTSGKLPAPHTITLDAAIPEGYITPSAITALKGERIILSLSGEALEKLDEDSLKVNGEDALRTGDTFWFTMPDTDVTLTAVFSDVSVNNPLVSIQISQMPKKTYYEAGESFDKTGMEVKALYKNGKEQLVSNYSISPEGALTAEVDSVEISFTDNSVTKTANVPIGVGAYIPKLESITVDKAPDKVSYTTGERFDRTGMVVTAHYRDGSSKEVTSYTVDMDVLNDNEFGYIDVEIDYNERGILAKTVQRIYISVSWPAPWKLVIEKGPDKTEYYEGERFDPTGMDIKLYWHDDDVWDAASRIDTIDPADCIFDPDILTLDNGTDPTVYPLYTLYMDTEKNIVMGYDGYDDPSLNITVHKKTDTTAVLTAVHDPAPVIVTDNGAEKSPEGLGLPERVEIDTDKGIKNADVTWLTDEADYDPHSKERQTFTVSGLVKLPDDVININEVNIWFYDKHIQVRTAVNVTVEAADEDNPDINDPAETIGFGDWKLDESASDDFTDNNLDTGKWDILGTITASDGYAKISTDMGEDGHLTNQHSELTSRNSGGYGYYEARYRCSYTPGVNSFRLFNGEDALNAREICISEAHPSSKADDGAEYNSGYITSISAHDYSQGYEWYDNEYHYSDREQRRRFDWLSGPDEYNSCSDDFYTYGCLYEPDKITYYINGEIVYVDDLANSSSYRDMNLGDTLMKIILGNSIDFSSEEIYTPDELNNGLREDESGLNINTMYIDYVHYFERTDHTYTDIEKTHAQDTLDTTTEKKVPSSLTGTWKYNENLSDEFDDDEINLNKWNLPEHGEDEYNETLRLPIEVYDPYSAEHIVELSGIEGYDDYLKQNGGQYNISGLTTKDRYADGYFEFRAKPSKQDTSGIIYIGDDENYMMIELMGDLKEYPDWNNMVRMQGHVGGEDTDQLTANLSEPVSSDYHVYGLLAEDDQYTLFIDGEIIGTLTGKGPLDGDNTISMTQQVWDEDLTAEDIKNSGDNNFYIDYIRYYEGTSAPTTYTITFRPGEFGEIGGSSEDIVYAGIETGSEFPEIPSAEPDVDYIFEGWFDGSQKIETFPDTVTEDKIYVAKFKKDASIATPPEATPSDPSKPDKPATPSEPDKPVTPDDPSKPDKPVTPDDPSKPDKPVTPDDPSKPDKPVTPDSPVHHSGGGTTSSSGSSGAGGPGAGIWLQDNIGWWYKNNDGTYPVSCWRLIGNQWYYFDSKGYMVTGWIQIDSKWYYLQSSGAMAKGQLSIEGKNYLFGADGALIK